MEDNSSSNPLSYSFVSRQQAGNSDAKQLRVTGLSIASAFQDESLRI